MVVITAGAVFLIVSSNNLLCTSLLASDENVRDTFRDLKIRRKSSYVDQRIGVGSSGPIRRRPSASNGMTDRG
jgi:hypothetical protein